MLVILDYVQCSLPSLSVWVVVFVLFLERSSLAGSCPQWKTTSFCHNHCWWEPVTARQSVSSSWAKGLGSRIQNWALKRRVDAQPQQTRARADSLGLSSLLHGTYCHLKCGAKQEKESCDFPGVWKRAGWRLWLSKAPSESLRYTRWDLNHCLKFSTDISALSNINSYDVKRALNFKMLFWIEFRDNIPKNTNHRNWSLFMYCVNWSLISRDFFY